VAFCLPFSLKNFFYFYSRSLPSTHTISSTYLVIPSLLSRPTLFYVDIPMHPSASLPLATSHDIMTEPHKPESDFANDRKSEVTATVTESSRPDSTMTEEKPVHSVLDSKFPVFLPFNSHLFTSDKDFAAYVTTLSAPQDFTLNEVEEVWPTPAESTKRVSLEAKPDEESATSDKPAPVPAPFKEALMKNLALNQDHDDLEAENKMLTENGDVAFVTTKSSLVDLFYELTETALGDCIEEVLAAAWNDDPLATLKIIFNARSIHLGKASKPAAYHAMGWMYQKHPQTFLVNLPWLVRPVIEKKVSTEDKKESKSTDVTATNPADSNDDDDFDMVSEFGDAQEPSKKNVGFQLLSTDAPLGSNTTQFDVKNGVAHGYWKDLLNMLALAVNGEFHAKGNVRKILNVQGESKKRLRNWSAEEAKTRKHNTTKERHDRVLEKLKVDPTYEAFHIAVARLFASQLRVDSAALKSAKGRRNISLAAKWAPSFGEFHDKHTFIASSIAEILHSHDSVCPEVNESDRELYLKHARLAYRNVTVSPLRKFLAVVERDIAAETFANIKYERVPSLAMDRYQGLFVRKDETHFLEFLDKVTNGSAKVSGAVLLPSNLVARVSGYQHYRFQKLKGNAKASAIQGLAEQQLLDGQWKSLVERIRDNGKLESSIAVCDVSGSMTYPCFADGTNPMDSAIGLALLLAEITEEPFGGCFITFSTTPTIQKVGGPSDKRSFSEKVKYIQSSDWGMSTDFVAVFEKLILPLAIKNKLKQEDMVKQVFVFSDMQFDSANEGTERWSTSYERIEKQYKAAGYEMPTLIFWNLAATSGHVSTSKPVEADEPGTAMVSGYSQGQMKMFLDGGKFEELETEEEIKDEEIGGSGDDGDLVGVRVSKKKKVDPISIVRKAISHPAYQMLKVVD
jgi:hypothetical protein